MLSRREFMTSLALGGAIVGMPPSMWAATPATRAPVVSIHMDQPYIDTTGRAVPYVPPAGLRSAAPIANLTEQQIRSHCLCF
jgi:hypothetical protein